ncbi:MAG: RNA polymerase sigma factor, partial [Acidimicrobiales bacterium]
MLTQQTDAELVALALRGDRSAFAAIYDRYADKLFEFARSVLRDSDGAADVTQDAFVLAAERLEQLREPSKLRAWLYAIARNEATRHGRARSRTTPTDEVTEMASDGAGPEVLSARDDLAALVWDAAAGLSKRDRILLELTLRQGLDGQELADAIGTTSANAYSMASRLRDQVERSLGALLVARHARKGCDELQVLLAGWDGSFGPLVRKRVARHVERCEI